MNAPAKKLTTVKAMGDLFGGETPADIISGTHTEELLIALCGPIGSPLHDVAEALKDLLDTKFHYDKTRIIRLSSFIEEFEAKQGGQPVNRTYFAKTKALIQMGNDLRQQFTPSVLAELAVKEVYLDREEHKRREGHARYVPRRVCHIVDSIKNQHELDLLRTVYQESLYVVGVFSPLKERENNLAAKGLSMSEIYQLIDRDSGEELEHGQTVGDTFPQSDYFLRVDSQTVSQLRLRVDRFLSLVLRGGVLTPTKNEAAMYSAASASWNSACLSRQVGASITDANGELLGVGWNDVPKAKGGLYTNSDGLLGSTSDDMRCWNWKGGRCFNDEEKEELGQRLLDSLVEAGISIPDREKTLAHILKTRKLRGLIEFSRSIHAEMHAILNALKAHGARVQDGKLFVTTFPCHACARHIVAAGIAEVYFIEPYKKSLALKLHEDSMTELEADQTKVRVLPYEGVAPGRYLAVFRMQPESRKENGRAVKSVARLAKPKLEKTLEALPVLEKVVVHSLVERHVIADPSGNYEQKVEGGGPPPAAA